MKTTAKFDGIILTTASLAAIVLSGIWALSTPDLGERLMAAGLAGILGLGLLLALFHRGKHMPYIPLREWCTVSFDEHALQVYSAPPGAEAWSQQALWSDIARAEVVEEGLYASDRVLLFADESNAPMLDVPTEAKGGREFLQELFRRELLDPKALLVSEGKKP